MPKGRQHKKNRVHQKAKNRELEKEKIKERLKKKWNSNRFSLKFGWIPIFLLFLLLVNSVAGLVQRISTSNDSSSLLLGRGRGSARNNGSTRNSESSRSESSRNNEFTRNSHFTRISGSESEFAKVSDVSDKVLPNKGEMSSSLLPRACHASLFKPVNQPGMRLDVMNIPFKGVYWVPDACHKGTFDKEGNFDKECLEKSVLLYQFKNQRDLMKFKGLDSYQQCQQKRFHPSFYQNFLKELGLKEEMPFPELQGKLDFLRYASRLFFCEGEGCAGFSALSALRMLVSLRAEAPDISHLAVNGESIAHHYLVLDSGLKPTTMQGQAQVKHLLSTMKGYICDAWNANYFSSVEDNTLKMYKPEAGWEKVTVKNIKWKYDVSHLAPEAQQLFKSLNKKINEGMKKLMKYFNFDVNADYSEWDPKPNRCLS